MTLTCKCCLQTSVTAFGHLDFNKTCHDRHGGRVFPVSELQIPYFGCEYCGFVFTNHMDNWSMKEFGERIYNEDYSLADGAIPGYENVDVRGSVSYQNGLNIVRALDGSQKQIRILDYGSGGNPGATGLALLDQGFDVYSYEPHFVDASALPTGQFDFIIAIEVVEHCHDLVDLGNFLQTRLSRDGIFYIQTLLHPFPNNKDVLSSWYISPRNGHISIFTFRALAIFLRRYGLNLCQTVNGLVAFKNKPLFRNHYLI